MASSARIEELRARYPGPLTLRPPLGARLLLLCTCLTMAVVAVLMILRWDRGGFIFGALFGLGGVALGRMILGGGLVLVLDEDGFESRRGRAHTRLRWRDVNGFAVRKVVTNQLVAFDILRGLPEDGPTGALAATNSALIGRNATLPESYGLSPAELAELMTWWRARAVGVR